jgi:hypothetical protein
LPAGSIETVAISDSRRVQGTRRLTTTAVRPGTVAASTASRRQITPPARPGWQPRNRAGVLRESVLHNPASSGNQCNERPG